MLQPTVRRTWAPRGQTPIHKCSARHDRISAIAALTVSPQRRRLGLYFDLLDHNVRAEDFEGFIASLLGRPGRPITLVMDRASIHRCAARRLSERFGKRVHVEWLPAYAPELNPAEGVWGHAKHADLANFLPEDADELGRAVDGSLRATADEQSLLRSFFQHARLPL